MSIQESRRSAFQAWFAENYPSDNVKLTSEKCQRKILAEAAWNAALDSVVVVLPEPFMYEDESANCGFGFDTDKALEAITAAGICVEVAK